MSSTECELQHERPERPGEFTFTWSIENYSYCAFEYCYWLDSPSFEVELLGNEKFKLQLYPSGRPDCPGFINCYLSHYKASMPFNFTLSIRMKNGKFKEGGEDTYNLSSDNKKGYSKFVSLQDLKGNDGYLANDTITIRCRIWKTDADPVIESSTNCDALTRIRVSKLDYTWVLNGIDASLSSPEIGFRHSLDIAHFFKGMPSLKIHVFNEGNCDANALYFGVEMGERKEHFYYMICLIHLIDAGGRIIHTAHCQHFFLRCKPSERINFPLISRDKINVNKALYLHKGELTLRFELGFASDYELETFIYRTTRSLELQPSMNNADTDGHELWIQNVKECFEGGKFSDFIIRTPSRQFPVSKSILSAQSAVFEAMFERDMKERKTGIVDIEDLDDDTVSLMLIYVYTNTIEFIDSSAALKLYFAADKYGITALQKKCFQYLKSCLDESNVCEVLVLADTHQDHDLKSCVRDFIQARAQKILNSESWKKLVETNPHLGYEITHWIICNSL